MKTPRQFRVLRLAGLAVLACLVAGSLSGCVILWPRFGHHKFDRPDRDYHQDDQPVNPVQHEHHEDDDAWHVTG
ncbi:MAG: hypothetical protein HKM06_03210 [Spirochaetales bacterium]|nr:hypothetical protein [Spirochaetales bacterium]